MSKIKNLFNRILNPRTNYDNVPSFVQENIPGQELPAGARSHLSVRDLIFNLPFMLGMLIVIGLFLLVLFGPIWAPKNPYIAGQHIVPHYDSELKEFIRPPLAPSDEFPLGTDRWGTDLMSLLMHGARNTLVASAFISMVRLILGVSLGGYAGWNENQTADRIIMGLIGVITSIPMLISSMILIYALDIRKGLIVFIVALSVIGWTEIAQYIRSEFLILRKMPYIEGAHAVGSRALGIAVRHIIPNILPQLLVLAFLEMGSVLLLLGELGFVGIYIGGGHQIAIFEMMAPTQIFTLAEVPEWGAMLAEGYIWLRSKPFVVAPPAIAFFIAIVGFTSLGEGLRRLIEKRSLNTSFLLRKRMVLVIVAVSFATFFILNNTGAAPWFTKVAQAFNGNIAYEHIDALSQMEGRSAAQTGGEEASEYIQKKFTEYGLDPGWKRLSYVFPLKSLLVQPLSQPTLAIVDQDGIPTKEFRHQIDFGYVIEGHGSSGEAQLPLTFIGFTPGSIQKWESYKNLDLRDRIIMLKQGNAPSDFATEALIHGARGVLWIVGEGRDDVRSQIQWSDPEMYYQQTPSIPIMRIRSTVADAFLQPSDISLPDLISGSVSPDQSGPGWFAKDIESIVHISLDLSEPVNTEIPCILGYRVGSDLELATELVVIFTSYDGLGTDPDGTVFPAVNHNASSVGIMLEIARLWQEQELDTRRSVLFVAWGGGTLDNSGAREFLEDRFSFRHLITTNPNDRVLPALLIQLDDVGAGTDTLLIHPNSSPNLVSLLEETTRQFEISINNDSTNTSLFGDVVSRRVPWITLQWENELVSPIDDTLDQIEHDKLQSLGEALSLALTKIVRETDF
ncbi:MAG: ABC transporter permease subunit [Chloroflexi bacterium]|nr:ABC transporter permease subunit [Chloroflexota bacterium]